MNWSQRILLSFTIVLFPIVIYISLYNLFWYTNTPVDLEYFDPTKYYFGFSSLYAMLQDWSNNYTWQNDVFFGLVMDTSDNINTLLTDIANLGLIELIGRSVYMVLQFVSLPFYFIGYLSAPFTSLIQCFIKAYLGMYNIPIPNNQDYLMDIPNLLIVPINTLIQCMN